jgi:RNA polymerase sigma-70 factor (ECF subfamily)
MPAVSTDNEQKIRDAHATGRLKDAATVTLETYGSEVLSFLSSRLRSTSDAQEAFSMFVEDLWTGLPAFAWRCNMRTWAYTLARNAAARYMATPQRRAERGLDGEDSAEISKLAERLRSATDIYQKTEVKDRFRALRERLEPDDQMLLVLRVDRNLAWRDLALAMTGDVELDDASIEREAARLRKAFERVKNQLRSLAEQEGLLKARD